MSYTHIYSFQEENNLLRITPKKEVTLENSVAFMMELVSQKKFPDDILILQDHSQSTLKMSLTQVHFLEAFQRKYIDNFNSVKMAIVLSPNAEEAMLSLYYEAVSNNTNLESKVFDTLEAAERWLLKKVEA